MVDLLISGPEGKIEAKYNHNENENSPIVLIMHPDPSRGGTMHTKIAFQLYKTKYIVCRHRHRYEIDIRYKDNFEKNGLYRSK